MSVELVAEVGSNHNGDWVTAMNLISAAAECGADTVKFQHYPADRFGPHPMKVESLSKLQAAAKHHQIGFLCSVFDQQTLEDYLTECAPARVKIASPELTHHDLLRACRNAGLHVILSAGMSTMDEIHAALNVILETTGDDENWFTLLQCVSSYPAPPEEMNLSVMREWIDYWCWQVGLSDHTEDPIVAPVAATAMGAVMIEKHFTLDRSQDGPDHSYALDPAGFRQMVNAVRLAESMLGDGRKIVQPSEDPFDRRTEEWR